MVVLNYHGHIPPSLETDTTAISSLLFPDELLPQTLLCPEILLPVVVLLYYSVHCCQDTLR
jgi:hypothetical protein